MHAHYMCNIIVILLLYDHVTCVVLSIPCAGKDGARGDVKAMEAKDAHHAIFQRP